MKTNFEVNDIVSFQYKSRKVKGTVIRVDDKGLLINLHTDYIGKNEEWFAMEDKYFFIANMSKVSIKKQKLLNTYQQSTALTTKHTIKP